MTTTAKCVTKLHDSSARVFFVDRECGGEFGCGTRFYKDYYNAIAKRHGRVDLLTLSHNPWISRCDLLSASGRAEAARHPLFVPFTFVNAKPQVNRAVFSVLYRWESLGADERLRLYTIGTSDALPMTQFLESLPSPKREAAINLFSDSTVRILIAFSLQPFMCLLLSVFGLQFFSCIPQSYSDDVEFAYALDLMNYTVPEEGARAIAGAHLPPHAHPRARPRGHVKDEFTGVVSAAWYEHRQIPFSVIANIVLGINRGIMLDAFKMRSDHALFRHSNALPIFFALPHDIAKSLQTGAEIKSNHIEMNRLALLAFATQPGSGGPAAFARMIGMRDAKVTIPLDHPSLLCLSKRAPSGAGANKEEYLVVARIRFAVERLNKPILRASVRQFVVDTYIKRVPALAATLAMDGSDAVAWLILETIYASNVTTCPWFDRSPECLAEVQELSVACNRARINKLDGLYKKLEALVTKHDAQTREALLVELLNDPTLNTAPYPPKGGIGKKRKARESKPAALPSDDDSESDGSVFHDAPLRVGNSDAPAPRHSFDAPAKMRLSEMKARFTLFEMPLNTPCYMKVIGRAPRRQEEDGWTPFNAPWLGAEFLPCNNLLKMLSF